MSFMAGRTAASQSYAEGRLWADPYCSTELITHDAALLL